jgi:hypothetical protein
MAPTETSPDTVKATCDFHYWEYSGHATPVLDESRSNGSPVRTVVFVRKCLICGAQIQIPSDATVNDEEFVATYAEQGVIMSGKGFVQAEFEAAKARWEKRKI